MIIAVAGCNRNSGPPRYHLEGKITAGGEPVPAGRIVFAPDGDKGNGGPGTVARIEEGYYELPARKGHVGGPHVLTITGYDGKAQPKSMKPLGDILFPAHKVEQDLERESTTLDLELPAPAELK